MYISFIECEWYSVLNSHRSDLECFSRHLDSPVQIT